ncbi:hypothetical protein CMZ82_03385 [Lysobacteraceae bacterium NML93-0792]|nr:hypothetical protein CMZ82_03385 [Xanthomonadaceae bacterium NML93-0792]PBS15901.1 hypothetical protein CMZ81_08115 [Xanthomonadaceae bacterium NML93-0793]PBS18919.1 hypothetical protein CMZ80_09485 [Xanthomonadaceae bacterium NML93-0831]
MSAGEMADTATQTMPVVGHAIFDHAAEVQRILLQLSTSASMAALRSRTRCGSAGGLGRAAFASHLATRPVACRRSAALTLPV